MINQASQRTAMAKRSRRSLLATTALVSCLVGLVTTVSASAQTVTVSGDVSPFSATSPDWNVGGDIEIGVTGPGALSIEGGGTVTTTVGVLGLTSASTGAATVTGAGSTWTNSDVLFVGVQGSGTLIIEEGGAISNTDAYIGHASGTGTATVTGAGSAWTNSGSLYVGNGGVGTLSIEDGGGVTGIRGFIGSDPGSIGRATVSGAGSSWTNSGLFFVGDGGDGTLEIENGGTVSNSFAYVGLAEGAVGTVTVSGAGSAWTNNGELTIGVSGAGALTVAGEGAVGNTTGILGYGAGSTGTANVTGAGSTWTNTRDLIVGRSGTGALNIEDGGSVSNAAGSIGQLMGSSGEAVVAGVGSAWANTGSLTVGYGGDGALTVKDGGAVSNRIGYIGFSVGSSGVATVAGDASTWVNSGDLLVGYSGKGILSIENGGSVTNRVGAVGFSSGLSGEVAVSGAGSTWTNDSSLFIGTFGTGTLTIADGGAVSSADGYIGRNSGSIGAVIVRDSGSSWTSSSSLYVGNAGFGTLNIADGGAISAPQLRIADVTGSTGTLNIGAAAGDAAAAAGTLSAELVQFGSGTGSLNFNHTETNYAFAPAISGAGAINQIAGTTSLTGDSSGFAGPTSISGGVLLVDGSLGEDASTVGVANGGGLGGMGTIGGSVIVADGSLIGVQGRTLSMSSLALGEDSTVDATLGVAGDTALFDVSGDLTLDGTLNVTDAGGFGAGIYRLIDYGGDLTNLGLDIGTTPAGVDAADLSIQTVIDQQVNLVSTSGAELLFWDGGDAGLHNNGSIEGGDGIWDATNANWTEQDGVVNGAMRPMPGFAVFQGASGTVTVDDSPGPISATGMQFAVDGYVIEGDAIELAGDGSESLIRVGDGSAAGAGYTATIASNLTGAGSLVKTDLGTLILEGDNTYQGGTELRNGTLSVSSDTNLGAASGDITFAGGMLASTASFDSARAVVLGSNGLFDVADATTLGLSGTISGAGDLVKRGTGTLELSGDNAYGNTLVEAGTLIGDAGTISGNIGNAGTVVFDQAADTSFAGDIVGLGGSTGTMIKRDAGTLTLAGSSRLDWTVDAGGLVSATNRFVGDLAIGADGGFTFDQAYAGSYAGTISGAGALLLIGGGAVTLTSDSSGFVGTTALSDMTLVVNDALGGSLSILDGGRLEGIGTVGTTTVASGGTLAPGNSIGTLTVNGDLSFAVGSRYEVEANPEGTDSDLLHVTGNVTLDGGAVAHIGATGEYELRSTYTILSADGSLSGAFDDVTSDFAFLTPDLLYDHGAGTVDLELVRNDRNFASLALTSNQIATAQGIESIAFDAGHAVYDAIAKLADDDHLIRASFDALSGEIHASAITALIEDSRFIRNAANDRIRAAFGDTGATVTPVLAYGPGGAPTLVAADHVGPVFWSHGFGSWGSTDGDGNAASLDRSTGGLLVGADTALGDWRVGLLAGYSQSSFDAQDRASSGSSTNYHLGLYGGTEWGDLALRTGAAYTWHDIETKRMVAIRGLADALTGDYSAATFQVFGELAYGLELDSGSRLEPFANLAHASLHRDGFAERGGAAALSGVSETTGMTFTTLGLRGEHNLTLGTMDATLNGTVGWRHAFGDTTPESTHAFSAGDAFTIAGAPMSKDTAIIEAGLDLNLTPDAAFGLSYTGQLSSDAADHGFKANLNVRF